MSIHEFKNKVNLLWSFSSKMKDETIPHHFQKIIIRIYANELNINLTDTMIDTIIYSN